MMKMEQYHVLGLLLLLIVLFAEEIACMGWKSRYDPKQASESDYEEYDMGEMRELMQDQWEVDIQRDICPWAECTYCPCSNGRPVCSEMPPIPPLIEYRGPLKCKEKDVSGTSHTTCFFRGGNPKLDCQKQNQDIGVCFPPLSSTNDHLQKICLAYTSKCEYIEEFCDCARACASTRPPNPHPSSRTTARPAAITDRRTVVQTLTTINITPSTNGGSNKNRTISITTGTPERINPSSLSPDIRDNGAGFQSIFSTVGVLALSFCGLVFVCLVFVIMLACTCSCKRRRDPAKLDSESYPEQHAYHYVDVNNLGNTDKQGRNKQTIGNPVYDAQLLPTDHEDVGAVYSEANLDMVVSPQHRYDDEDENQYAECRPTSHISAVPTEATSSAYMELNDNSAEVQNEHLYRVLGDDSISGSGSIYIDLHLGQDDGQSHNNSDTNTPSTAHDSTSSSAHDDSSSGSGISITSADSGVEDQRNNMTSSDFEGDNSHSNNATVSDFEGDNSYYFEATTLPFSGRKSNHSFESNDSQNARQDIKAGAQKDDITTVKEEGTHTKFSNYQKLRCQNFTKDRSFSIDSACSDNNYNTLTSRGTLTLAECDGKYSTLVREGQESKRRENESSDGDNMYSELNRNKKC